MLTLFQGAYSLDNCNFLLLKIGNILKRKNGTAGETFKNYSFVKLYAQCHSGPLHL